MTLIRHADRRRTETPNGVMTTFASPTQGGTGTAVWHVDMPAGRQGPRHAFETEQIWCFLDGAATIDLGAETLTVTAGDTVVMPADVPRQVTTGTETGFTAVVTAPAGSRVYNADSDCDIAPKDGERLVPPWAR
ncbi:cupin domain-containing protein [Spirillospora sp. NPDC029432]|uniref:cupin domain-containing protein n=1 Tax=Spirillospora sp. NPDC029432 TaxID=3154599 RepID=UPI003456FFE5